MPRHHAPFDAAFIQTVNEHQFGLGDDPSARVRCPNCARGLEQPDVDVAGLVVADTDGLLCLECGHLDPAPNLPASVTDTDGRVRWAQVLFHDRTATIDALLRSLRAHPSLAAQAPGASPDSAAPVTRALRSALGALQRYALLCEGVETRPGRAFEITSDWASIRDCCPPPGWVCDVLYHLEGVSDPCHPAFGAGWHIVRRTSEEPVTLARARHDVYGRAHYWRNVD